VLEGILLLGEPVTEAPPRRVAREQVLLEAVFTEHYTGFCRLAALLLDDRAAAEEVVQEAFVRTFCSWWRLRQPERAQWYVRTAFVNLCRSRLRRRGREDTANRASWPLQERPSDDHADDAMAVLEAVRALPRRQRETVVLRYYEDLPEREVAAALGCSVGTVKSQLARARATLAQRLAPGAGSDTEEGSRAG